MIKDEYEKSAEKILSLDSNWKNGDDNFKKATIRVIANTLKYIETHKNTKCKTPYDLLICGF